MAYTPTHDSIFHATRPGAFTRARSWVGHAFIRWAEACSRADRIAALTAKSDAELTAMGLRREDIVRYVFRDRAGF